MHPSVSILYVAPRRPCARSALLEPTRSALRPSTRAYAMKPKPCEYAMGFTSGCGTAANWW